MATKYTYSISADITAGALDSDHLKQEIIDAGLATPLARINTVGNTLNIWFDSTLSAGDKTTLDNDTTGPSGGLVGNHDGLPMATIAVDAGRVGFLCKDTGHNSGEIAKGSWVDATGVMEFMSLAAIPFDITVSGAGGLDTGSEASSTWYAIYLIGDPTGTNPLDSLLSTSLDAPTLPSGYTVCRRVGWVRNRSNSDFHHFSYHTPYYCHFHENRANVEVLSSGSATSWSAVDCSAFCPPTSSMLEVSVSWSPYNLGDALYFRMEGMSEVTDSINIRVAETSSYSYRQVPFRMPLNMSNRKFEYQCSSSYDDVWVYVQGFHDNP